METIEITTSVYLPSDMFAAAAIMVKIKEAMDRIHDDMIGAGALSVHVGARRPEEPGETPIAAKATPKPKQRRKPNFSPETRAAISRRATEMWKHYRAAKAAGAAQSVNGAAST